jgi:hypothetical protein
VCVCVCVCVCAEEVDPVVNGCNCGEDGVFLPLVGSWGLPIGLGVTPASAPCHNNGTSYDMCAPREAPWQGSRSAECYLWKPKCARGGETLCM